MYTQTPSTQNDVDDNNSASQTSLGPDLSFQPLTPPHLSPSSHTMGMTLGAEVVCSLYIVLPARPQLLAYISTGRWQRGLPGDKLAGLT